jgi:regulatory protein YycH of two-component signal transduction system YycFG
MINRKNIKKILILVFVLLIIVLSWFFIKNQDNYNNPTWIQGKWKVVNSEILPFEHISYCENLNIGSVFNFKRNNVLKVYETKDSLKNCNEHQTYRVNTDSITVLESDFIFGYKIISHSTNNLVLASNRIDPKILKNLTKEQLDNIGTDGFKIYLER